MRLWILMTVLAVMSAPALAADEFGSRFSEQAPAGLESSEPEEALIKLQDIAPAAGDEADPDEAPVSVDPGTGTLAEDPAQKILKNEDEILPTLSPEAGDADASGAQDEITDAPAP